MTDSDFIANLKYLSTAEGGRTGYAASGYRPHIEFDNYPEYLTSGSQKFLYKEVVKPGESVVAEIKILGVEYFKKRLFKGKNFKFREGHRIIGSGEITRITNSDLQMEEGQIENIFNFNLFPNDIRARIREDFGSQEYKAIRILQPFLINYSESRSPRMVRSIIFLSNGKIEELRRQIEITKNDWRDTLSAAEYVGNDLENSVRIRNFNKEFGSENIAC